MKAAAKKQTLPAKWGKKKSRSASDNGGISYRQQKRINARKRREGVLFGSDREIAEIRENTRYFIQHSALFSGRAVAFGTVREQDRVEAMDAAYECKHGRLPSDRTEPCGCWPGEVA